MSQQFQPNDWKGFFESLTSKGELDANHEQVTQITFHDSTSPPNIQTLMRLIVDNQPGVVIAFKAPLGDIQLLHNTFFQGGSIGNPKISYYGLVGEGHLATAIQFDPVDMFQPLEKAVPIPDREELHNVDSRKALLELKTNKDSLLHRGLHAITIPPFVAKVFRSVSSGDPVEIIINLVAKAVKVSHLDTVPVSQRRT